MVLVQTLHDNRVENDMSFVITASISNFDGQTGILFIPNTAQIFITDDDCKYFLAVYNTQLTYNYSAQRW